MNGAAFTFGLADGAVLTLCLTAEWRRRMRKRVFTEGFRGGMRHCAESLAAQYPELKYVIVEFDEDEFNE